MLVSIITPLYNAAQFLEETIDSVLQQSYSNWEWIVIDDHSTDGSLQIIQNYAANDDRISCLKRPTSLPKGGSSCRNFGIDKSKGEFVVFLDADDLLTDSCLSSRLKIAEKYPNYGLYIFNTAYFSEGIIGKVINSDIHYNDYIRAFIRYEIPWCITSALWRKKSLDTLYFDEGLQRLQDPDCHLSGLLVKGIKAYRNKTEMVDSYYRDWNAEKWNNQEFVKIVANSFVLFIEKWTPVIKQTKNLQYEQDFRLFIYEAVRRISLVDIARVRYKLAIKIMRVLYNSNIFGNTNLLGFSVYLVAIVLTRIKIGIFKRISL